MIQEKDLGFKIANDKARFEQLDGVLLVTASRRQLTVITKTQFVNLKFRTDYVHSGIDIDIITNLDRWLAAMNQSPHRQHAYVDVHPDAIKAYTTLSITDFKYLSESERKDLNNEFKRIDITIDKLLEYMRLMADKDMLFDFRLQYRHTPFTAEFKRSYEQDAVCEPLSPSIIATLVESAGRNMPDVVEYEVSQTGLTLFYESGFHNYVSIHDTDWSRKLSVDAVQGASLEYEDYILDYGFEEDNPQGVRDAGTIVEHLVENKLDDDDRAGLDLIMRDIDEKSMEFMRHPYLRDPEESD